MNENDAIEQAYKNGYEAGVKEFAERLRKRLERKYTIYGREYVLRHIREAKDELIVNYESSKNDKQRKEDENVKN